MKPFEYVLVIISVIIGLSLAELALGVSNMIQQYRTAVYYVPYFAGILLVFLAMLHYWTTLYTSRNRSSWSVPQIGIVFIMTMCYYIMAQVGVPDQENFNQNYEEYFNNNAGALYSAGVLLGFAIFLESYMLKRQRQTKWYIITSVLSLLALSGALIDNDKFRAILTVFMIPAQIFNMYTTKAVVKE
jgi:hypothetical protein